MIESRAYSASQDVDLSPGSSVSRQPVTKVTNHRSQLALGGYRSGPRGTDQGRIPQQGSPALSPPGHSVPNHLRVAAEPQRRMRLLYRARHHDLLDGREAPPVEAADFAGPGAQQNLDGLVEELVAIGELDTKSSELGAEIAGPQHEGGSSAGQHVDGGHRLAEEQRVPVRHHGQQRHHPQLPGGRGQKSKAGERVQRFVAAVLEPFPGRRRVICEGKCADARRFRLQSELDNIVREQPGPTLITHDRVLNDELHRATSGEDAGSLDRREALRHVPGLRQ
jgi:hypothetical protein